MSTKALRRAIELLKGGRSSEEWQAGRDAEAELKAIEKAAKDFVNGDTRLAVEAMKVFNAIASEAK